MISVEFVTELSSFGNRIAISNSKSKERILDTSAAAQIRFGGSKMKWYWLVIGFVAFQNH
jgi:hypothetical protein